MQPSTRMTLAAMVNLYPPRKQPGPGTAQVGSGTVRHNFYSGYWLTTGIRKMDESSELGYA